MSSHPDLKNYYLKFGQLVDSIEKASSDILAKVENAEKQTPLAVNIGMLCRHVMLFISDIYFSYRNEGQYYPPLRFLNVFSTLAHRLYVCLGFMNKEEKEDLLKYFNEWNGINPGAYEGLLRENSGLLYNHQNIRPLMICTSSMTCGPRSAGWNTSASTRKTSWLPNAPDNRRRQTSHAGTYWTDNSYKNNHGRRDRQNRMF